MAKILTTKGSSAALEDILLKAEKEVYLISFSYIINEPFLKILKRATDKGVVIRLVYGKSIKTENELMLSNIPNLQILHLPNLHAKIFANEAKAIVGSMNFSEASELNNTELGVLLTVGSDESAFKEVIDHCKHIVSEAKLERPMMPKEIHDKHKTKAAKDTRQEVVPKWMVTVGNEKKEYKGSNSPKGYCIRTGERIPLNHLKPFCSEAYASWANWEEDEYPENYDHFTGEATNGETCKATPILQKNWKKYIKVIEALPSDHPF